MGSLIKILLVSSSILFSTTLDSCGTNKPLWKDITNFFKNDTLTINEIKRRISDKAIESIVNTDTLNKAERVRVFFNGLSSRHDYSFNSDDSLLYIIFNRNDKIAGGPTIEVKRNDKDWYITDVRFGK